MIGIGISIPEMVTWENQGIHQMDIARWFLGYDQISPRVISIGGRLGYEDAADTPNTQTVIHDYPGAPLIFETRGLPKSKKFQNSGWGSNMDDYRGSKIGVVIQAEKGHLLIPNSYNWGWRIRSRWQSAS